MCNTETLDRRCQARHLTCNPFGRVKQPCLGPISMAGFEVTTEDRLAGLTRMSSSLGAKARILAGPERHGWRGWGKCHPVGAGRTSAAKAGLIFGDLCYA
jgi:hypothetical protein